MNYNIFKAAQKYLITVAAAATKAVHSLLFPKVPFLSMETDTLAEMCFSRSVKVPPL